MVERLNGLCPKSPYRSSSLCNLCVLCASVVKKLFVKTTTEDTETTQRNQTFRAKLVERLTLHWLSGFASHGSALKQSLRGGRRPVIRVQS